MSLELPPLPWPADALEPYMSARTLSFHHGKHHQAYVTNLCNLLGNGPLASAPLEDIIRQTAGKPDQAGIFNNAAQVWNHSFFWNSMRPGGGGDAIPEPLGSAIREKYGDVDGFAQAFRTAAVGQFGSGWAWLTRTGDSLEIVRTPNAGTPIASGGKPLLTCDVWEHAYYLDYQNRRPDFVQAFLDHLVNWEFANRNFQN